MIALGIILLILGYVLKVYVLETIGIILLVIGAVLWVLGSVGRPVAEALLVLTRITGKTLTKTSGMESS